MGDIDIGIESGGATEADLDELLNIAVRTSDVSKGASNDVSKEIEFDASKGAGEATTSSERRRRGSESRGGEATTSSGSSTRNGSKTPQKAGDKSTHSGSHSKRSDNYNDMGNILATTKAPRFNVVAEDPGDRGIDRKRRLSL